MTLLIPLGLLALLSIIALIIIYIIKPNYQQKHISSTFIWQLSMKYKKRRLPVSKLRNLLIIICQLLILAAIALIIAKPAQPLKDIVTEREVIAIIDSSASMRTEMAGESRFERAVNGVKNLSDEVFSQGGIVSVIVAEEQPYFLAQRITSEKQSQLNASFENLLEDGCSYGSSDLDGAMTACEEILADNSAARVHVFTDVSFDYKPEAIEVVSVVDAEEWNAAILDVTAESYENYFKFTVELATYGIAAEINLKLEVQGVNVSNANQEGAIYTFSTNVRCDGESVKTVIFQNADISLGDYADNSDDEYFGIPVDKKIFSYQSVHAYLEVDDNFPDDDAFNIYAGQKEVLRVQYASTKVHPFFTGLFDTLTGYYKEVWDVEVKTVRMDAVNQEVPATEGFDFYIFEHQMPEKLPEDGVVFLIDPQNEPIGAGFRLGGELDYEKRSLSLTEENAHPILNFVNADNITVSRIMRLTQYDAGFEVLLTCDNAPVFLVKNEGAEKVALMNFSVHYSNVTITEDFALIMLNMFEYFMPRTVNGHSFEVNEVIQLNCRGDELSVTGFGLNKTYTEFPASLQLTLPGVYAITQQTTFGKNVIEEIYVRIPKAESNILGRAETIKSPYAEQTGEGSFNDLIIYVAAALVALMCIEWLLQSRENM